MVFIFLPFLSVCDHSKAKYDIMSVMDTVDDHCQLFCTCNEYHIKQNNKDVSVHIYT